MSATKTFVVVFLAVLLAIVSANWYQSYSQSHLLISFQRVLMADTREETGDLSIDVIETPFHRANGVHLYLIPYYQVKTEEGYWMPPEDNSWQWMREGTHFIAFADNAEDHELSYILVCSTKEFKTYEEVEKESWNQYLQNDIWFEPSEGNPSTRTIQCK